MDGANAQAKAPPANTRLATRYAARGPRLPSRRADNAEPRIEAAINNVVFQA